jgi:hypothetical protein
MVMETLMNNKYLIVFMNEKHDSVDSVYEWETLLNNKYLIVFMNEKNDSKEFKCTGNSVLTINR